MVVSGWLVGLGGLSTAALWNAGDCRRTRNFDRFGVPTPRAARGRHDSNRSRSPETAPHERDSLRRGPQKSISVEEIQLGPMRIGHNSFVTTRNGVSPRKEIKWLNG